MAEVYSFLLNGHVQGVKMRRYIESAARFFQLKGFVVNLEDGAVFGEAWHTETGSLANNDSQLHRFRTWIRGEWPEVILTDVKPTPVGTAYPAKASVNSCRGFWWESHSEKDVQFFKKLPEVFTMVRDDAEAAVMISERFGMIDFLRGPIETANLVSVESTSWPMWTKISH